MPKPPRISREEHLARVHHGHDDRLKRAYATAMKASHEGGRVQIYMGSDLIEHLRSLAIVPDPNVTRTTCWGFDVFPVSGPPDHLSVHVVQTIL